MVPSGSRSPATMTPGTPSPAPRPGNLRYSVADCVRRVFLSPRASLGCRPWVASSIRSAGPPGAVRRPRGEASGCCRARRGTRIRRRRRTRSTRAASSSTGVVGAAGRGAVGAVAGDRRRPARRARAAARARRREGLDLLGDREPAHDVVSDAEGAQGGRRAARGRRRRRSGRRGRGRRRGRPARRDGRRDRGGARRPRV